MTLALRDIEYFVAIADHGNLGRAAESLGLSQPALSKSLRRLETSMQTRLVKKTPKGVELTTVGTAFLRHVRGIRLSLEDVAKEVTDLTQGRAGHLRIGAGPGFNVHLLPRACELLLKEAPKVTLKITIASRNEIYPALRKGELDLVLTNLPASLDGDLASEYFCDDEFIVYCAVDHPLARKRNVTLADLAREDWALSANNVGSAELIPKVFQQYRLPPPRIQLETSSIQLRHHVIASSRLLGFSSRPVVLQAAPRFRFAELHVKELKYSRRTGVLYRKGGYLSPAARRLIEVLKATAKEIAKQS